MNGETVATPAGNLINIAAANSSDHDKKIYFAWFKRMTEAPQDTGQRTAQKVLAWRKEHEDMVDTFSGIKDLIVRLYDWYREPIKSHNKLLSFKLSNHCETTVARLFGKKSIQFLQLVFLDIECLDGKLEPHGVAYTA